MRIENKTNIPTLFLRRWLFWSLETCNIQHKEFIVKFVPSKEQYAFGRRMSQRDRQLTIQTGKMMYPVDPVDMFNLTCWLGTALDGFGGPAVDHNNPLGRVSQEIGLLFTNRSADLIHEWRQGVVPIDGQQETKQALARATTQLVHWQRKQKLAGTKIRKYTRRIKHLNKKLLINT